MFILNTILIFFFLVFTKATKLTTVKKNLIYKFTKYRYNKDISYHVGLLQKNTLGKGQSP